MAKTKKTIARGNEGRPVRNKAKDEGHRKPSTRPAAAVREYPRPPFPRQHQDKPGIEADLSPRPEYEGQAYRAAGKLQGRVALITGGDSGIGRSVAVLFAREGADVAIGYLPEEQSDAEETRQAVEAQSRKILMLPGDVGDPEYCRSCVQRVVSELGHLDILVNNAAYQQHQSGLEDLSDEQWDHTFRTNIYGYFYMARAALPYLKKGSAIINTGSITGLEGSK